MAENKKRIEGFDFDPVPYTTMHVIWGGPADSFDNLNALEQHCFMNYVYKNIELNAIEIDINSVYNTHVGFSPLAIPMFVAVNHNGESVYADFVIGGWKQTSEHIVEAIKGNKEVYVYNTSTRNKLVKYIQAQRLKHKEDFSRPIIKVLQDLTFQEYMYDDILDLAAHLYTNASYNTEFITNDKLYNSSYYNNIKEQAIGFAHMASKISESL